MFISFIVARWMIFARAESQADQVIQAVQPKGGITLVQAQQSASVLSPCRRKEGLRPAICKIPPRDLQQSACSTEAPRGPHGCIGTVPWWFGKHADGF